MRPIDADKLVRDHGFFIEDGDGFPTCVVCETDIRHYPTIDAVPVVREWIPVTERLPEKDGSYLVFEQGFWFGHGWCNVTSFTKDGRKIDEYDFQKDGRTCGIAMIRNTATA